MLTGKFYSKIAERNILFIIKHIYVIHKNFLNKTLDFGKKSYLRQPLKVTHSPILSGVLSWESLEKPE